MNFHVPMDLNSEYGFIVTPKAGSPSEHPSQYCNSNLFEILIANDNTTYKNVGGYLKSFYYNIMLNNDCFLLCLIEF